MKAHESGYGSSGREGSGGQLQGDASGMKEGREASGRHGRTAGLARARVSAACAAETVERGKKP